MDPDTGVVSFLFILCLYQRNEFWSLEDSRSVWEDVEWKLRCVNFKWVLVPRKVFQPAFIITKISDDWYRSAIGVTVIWLGTPQSTGENFVCTWKHQRQAWKHGGQYWKHLGAHVASLGAPATRLGVRATTLGTPPLTVELSGKNNIVFGNTDGEPRYHSYCLWFNNF
jgi:hypothetical protein